MNSKISSPEKTEAETLALLGHTNLEVGVGGNWIRMDYNCDREDLVPLIICPGREEGRPWG